MNRTPIHAPGELELVLVDKCRRDIRPPALFVGKLRRSLRRWYWYLWALILAGCWILRPLLAAVLSAALIPVRRLYRSHLPRRAAALARARDRHVVGQTVSASKSLL